ncbi:MAG: glycogen/starch synthase [Candidatus Portnoybacteria bacterium]|nr:glycogen/starch synthase [Candidatus Portnoybacteria bacterium]
MLKKKYSILLVSPEMMIPELGSAACNANFRGGLGILAGDIMEGLAKQGINATAIVPFNDRDWKTRGKINYDKIKTLPVANLEIKIRNREKQILHVRKVKRAGFDVYGLCSANIYDILYTGDKWQRFRQEILLGHSVPALLRILGMKPDIIWLQEGHTALVAAITKDNSDFSGAKHLFTNHTLSPGGLETYPIDSFSFDELGVDYKYYNIFVKDGLLNMSRGGMILADWITTVSLEHARLAKNGIFREFAHKITGIRNGSSRKIGISPRIKALEKRGGITALKLWEAHLADKRNFLEHIGQTTDRTLNPEKLIVGWVRRLDRYKNQWPMLAPIARAICAKRGEWVNTPFGALEGLDIQLFGAGRAHENDNYCLGWIGEFANLCSNGLMSKAIFLPSYSLELRRNAAMACDIWLSCPWPGWEACGTSDQIAVFNGNINIASCTGGPAEYIEEYNPVTTEGNGCFIEPYEPMTVYLKLKMLSDLYYMYLERGDERWLKLRQASYEVGKKLDVALMIEKYEEIFEKILCQT